ncbi:MAG: 50S ribosomal protein L3 [Deltaproteobacteria bacterium]|nr:50S ribosomal protein L3 [Deltaproteobacteria bacterium]MBW2076664.1 50S ribosomal protein L3 [Deltaproteobacteria bacterium]
MVKGILGKKIGMTRVFRESGESVPVTALEVGPCYIIQIKREEKEGYNAIQLGYQPKKEKKLNKPLSGHYRAAGKGGFKHLREIRVDDVDSFELGQEITLKMFHVGDTVTVRGLSKGRGFAGVVKRWGFSGGDTAHGCRSHRVPGSIGASATPSRVMRGKKLPGRMGNQRFAIRNLEVVDVVEDKGLLLVKGSVPGSRGGLLEVRARN